MSAERPSWRQSQTSALKRAIQSAALRLFAERGYAETTIGMIAEEVGIAERTCYRHFPGKPDLVLWDAADYDLLARFQARPEDEHVVAAFRAALRDGYAMLTDDQREVETRRAELIGTVPEVRAAHLGHLATAARDLLEVVTARSGRTAGDPEVVAVCGALVGTMMLAQAAPSDVHDGAGPGVALDEVLAELEKGLGAL